MARLTKKRLKEIKELETEDTKYCSICKKIKPLYEFSVNAAGRKLAQTYCIKCEKERDRERNILKDHSITLKDYDKMLEKQGKKCKICGTRIPDNRPNSRFCIDHDHTTGKIRGLLCHNCNLMLGKAKDNIEILTSAIQYLIDSRK